MTTIAVDAPPRRVATGLGIAVLLALAIFINYVDRGSLATAGPLIKDELNLSSAQLGVLLSAFFWTYAPSQLLAGWMSERFDVFRTLALGFAIWSLATAASGLTTGFASLLILRLVLGVGESAAYPCISKFIARHVAPHHAGLANGMVGFGQALGPAFGALFGGLLMAGLGWRVVFVGMGVIALVWLWPWLAATRELRLKVPAQGAAGAPSFKAIFARRGLWGAALGHFSCNYALYFVLTWLPTYLVKHQGFTMGGMAVLSGEIYLVYAASSLSCGRLADILMRCGVSESVVRKGALICGHVLVAAAMLGCVLGQPRLSSICLFVAAIGFGMQSANLFAVGQAFAGPQAAGKWVGAQNFIGNLPGIIAPILTGLVVDRTGSFAAAFGVACLVSGLGVVAWAVVTPRIGRLSWGEAGAATSSP